VGDKVKMLKNRQVGVVKSFKGRNAIVQLGTIPINVNISELVLVVDKVPDAE
jgi:DNA mismatch repair protein MutS2